jgi:hypothetical protein
MQPGSTAIQTGGGWLALASVLMIAALALHGPIAAEPLDQMMRISNRALAWSVAHWLAAAALSFYAVAALIMLSSRSHLTERPSTLSAWAVIGVGALWTLNTAVSEATVITDAAVSGDSQMFAAWWAFAEGKANGFAFVVLAIAVVAASNARSDAAATPSWAASAAFIAGIGSFTGWALGMWLHVGVGMILWLVASILVALWTAWFGIALARVKGNARIRRTTPPRAGSAKSRPA